MAFAVYIPVTANFGESVSPHAPLHGSTAFCCRFFLGGYYYYYFLLISETSSLLLNHDISSSCNAEADSEIEANIQLVGH